MRRRSTRGWGISSADLAFGSYHWGKKCGKDNAPIPGKGYRPKGSNLDWQHGWHVYRVDWMPDRIDYYIDDVLYFSRTSEEVTLPPDPMYIILNQAVFSLLPGVSSGKGWDDGSEIVLEVDWVRVYENQS